MIAAVDPWILALSLLTVAGTIAMGFWAAGRSRTAADFFVAGRGVSVGWNASAISGEYLSAASFMGVAGMVMSSGYDALWYPVCYACGYLFLLLFIAGPLRRFGAYTIPDFAEGRYDSPVFRKIAVVFVLFIGCFYTMPQMKGAGTTLAYIFQDITWFGHKGLPYWVGVVLVGVVITFNVALGGMKGITLVQAFQYWMKMFAISVPVFVLVAVHGGYGRQLQANGPEVADIMAAATRAAAGTGRPDVSLATADGTRRALLPTNAPADRVWLNPFGPLTTKAAKAAKPAAPADGSAVKPLDPRPYALVYTYSLIIALVCGTAGLPHILVRFYTNPDGVAAKRTTMWVMILIGVFYVFPPVFGVLGRNLLPALYAGTGSKGTDKIVLELPRILSGGGVWGSVLSGVTCAGAFAAFMSTFSGLLVSMTGALAHDVYGRILKPTSTPGERMRMFKWCAVALGGVATLLGSLVEPLQINFMVGQAFAIAAASYFPLLFMSVWWRGMTMKGAATGMLSGGTCALVAVTLTNFSDLGWISLAGFWSHHPLLRILCEQPAIWCVPLAIGLMVVVSLRTRATVPADIRMKMLVLHAPEALGLKQEYIREHEGHAH
ncbi:MAG: cation acetate symporter [Verrucomicrobia bacterium]|nr:MAG: cation acetate symporter [Verrucomicrobiota bacterium]